MRRLFIVMFGVLAAANLSDAQVVQGYDDHGRRDPFKPLVLQNGAVIVYDSDLTATDMNLEGILADSSGKNMAIINGKVVKIGDHIGPYLVESVSESHVEVSKNNERITLKLNKRGI